MPNPIFVTRPTLPNLDDVHSLLHDVWNSQHVTNFGPLEKQFEANISEFLCLRDVMLFSNGHLAIEAMLRMLGNGRETGGEIITTPFTFASTLHAIVNTGFVPVFVDVDADGFGPCPEQVREAFSAKTKAVLGVHVYGVPCQVDALAEFCTEKNIALFFDAAHAFGVDYKGKSLISFGDASSVSLHATKIMSAIEGGVLACNASTFSSDAARRFRNFGIHGDDIIAGASNAKLSELHAAVGLLNLTEFKSTLARRLKIAAIYDKAFIDVSDFQPLRPSSPNASYYAIQFSGSQSHAYANRMMYMERAQQFGVFSRPYFSPSLDQTSAFGKYARGQAFERSHKLSASILCLPIYSTMTSTDQERVIQTFLTGKTLIN